MARQFDRLGGKGQANHIRLSMADYDMFASADEEYYLAEYWHWLAPILDSLPGAPRIVDVGCGQGRFAIPVARANDRWEVEGVDLAEDAVAAARRYAAEAGVSNVGFEADDAVAYLRRQPPANYDLALFTEVTFWMPAYEQALAELSRTIKPGGTLFVSFRSQYHNLLWRVKAKDFAGARIVRDQRKGYPRSDNAVEQFWHTPDDIREQLTSLSFEVADDLLAIGMLSGLKADPLSDIAQPSQLSEHEQSELRGLETALARQYAWAGRYILAVARRI